MQHQAFKVCQQLEYRLDKQTAITFTLKWHLTGKTLINLHDMKQKLWPTDQKALMQFCWGL
jgi:hypothetical protein